MAGRDRFAGGDQDYLRDVQYRDPSRLTARANLHARYSTSPIGWFDWVVSQIDWPQSAAVLEVGCGPGWLWAATAPRLPPGLRLTLTDLSPGMVSVARARVAGLAHFDALEARQADVEQIPYDDGAFDVVVANHMLYHAPDPVRAVAELARVLRHDGVRVAATIGPRHLRELDEIRFEILGGPVRKATAEAFGAVSGATILGQSFGAVTWRDYEDELHCTDPDDVVAFITSTPPGESATPAQRAALRHAVDVRMEAGDGVLVVSKQTGLFLARAPR